MRSTNTTYKAVTHDDGPWVQSQDGTGITLVCRCEHKQHAELIATLLQMHRESALSVVGLCHAKIVHQDRLGLLAEKERFYNWCHRLTLADIVTAHKESTNDD